MQKQIIRFDWAIKHILRNKANFDVLEGFLSELLGMDMKILEILESESNQKTEKDKFNRVDIMVATKDGERIIIEVQCETQVDYLSRILYGVSKAVAETLKKGQKYRDVKKVISVTIAYFDVGHGTDYVYRGRTKFEGLHDCDLLSLSPEEQAIYQNKTIEGIYPEYYIIRVNRFDRETRDNLDEWVYFLKTDKVPKNCKARGLKKAAEELDVLKLSPKKRQDYERYIESERDRASYYDSTYGRGDRKGYERGCKEGEKKGREEGERLGLQKGEKKKAVQIARNLRSQGLSVKGIIQATGLTQKDIETLD